MFDDPRSDDTRDRDDWRERDLDARDRERINPRDVFAEGLNLPRGRERDIVFDRGHHYEIRGSEARTLADVGAFRDVLSRDLQDHNGQPCDPRKGDLRSLREQGLVRTVQLDGRREIVVVLTNRGRDLLDSPRLSIRRCCVVNTCRSPRARAAVRTGGVLCRPSQGCGLRSETQPGRERPWCPSPNSRQGVAHVLVAGVRKQRRLRAAFRPKIQRRNQVQSRRRSGGDLRWILGRIRSPFRIG